ncbi:Protein tyrosine phosphatase [Dermatophagoides pteronyssinus]|uniref:Protein tyrosine phosphatase n=1 Tax=Dermatophagoides pteronyssinus TaxID=6956 RepID=A0ABQ8JVM2_DERPT|nr:Protein tyrosine phosphatase [Dermatophagoides pteronyssinus]
MLGDLGQQLEFHNIYTRRGSNTTIVCEPASRATKIYNIQWFKDERKVVEIENQRIINWQVGDHVSFVPETGALLLRSVSFRDSGDYLCLVNNKRENGQVRLMVQVINLSAGRHHDDRPIDLLHLVTTIYTFVCLFVYLGASGQVVIN